MSKLCNSILHPWTEVMMVKFSLKNDLNIEWRGFVVKFHKTGLPLQKNGKRVPRTGPGNRPETTVRDD